MERQPATAFTKPRHVIRTKYLIYPRFQLALVLANLLVVLVLFSFTMLCLRASLSEMKTLGQAAGLDVGHTYYQFLQLQAQAVLNNMMLALVASLIVSTLFIIWLSHRVVGPLVGLIRFLERLPEQRAQGKPVKPIRFRKNDFFHELADGINGALDLDPAAAEKPR